MAASHFDDASERSFALGDFSEASESGYYADHEDELEPLQGLGRSLFGLIFQMFGLDGERRNGMLENDSLPTLAMPNRGRRRFNPRKIRRFRPSSVTRAFKRALVAVPIFVLVVLYVLPRKLSFDLVLIPNYSGIIHILQNLIGRARLFWNVDTYHPSLVDWSRPGRPGAGLVDYASYATRGILPIPCHSHNDYWRPVPLFDAVRWGCTGVEADVWMYENELYVGSNTASLDRDRTFQKLYVDPLLKLLDQRSSATPYTTPAVRGVFDMKPEQTLVLLIDFKTSGSEIFKVVQQQLQPLREKNYLSYWNGDKFVSQAVTVVGTGSIPFETVLNETNHRDIFLDAPLHALWEQPRDPIDLSDPLREKDGDMDYGKAMSLPAGQDATSETADLDFDAVVSPDAFNTSNSYYASTSFAKTVGFVWRGHLSPRQMQLIRGQIRGAKRRGLKARYWDTPSWPIALRNHVWHVLIKEGADVLNVDDLKAAAMLDWKTQVLNWLA